MINSLSFPQTDAAIAMANPLAGADQQLAGWFHAHLTQAFVNVLRVFSEPGSGEWIGVVLFLAVLFFIWKRWWPSLVTMIVAVPGGMLLNELLKILVQRHRPFLEGPFVDWTGYSFASGHTIGATLLYGQLALLALPIVKTRPRRTLVIAMATILISLVGFSRIALGAHYLTDVLAAISFGVFWLAFCVVVEKSIRRRHLPAALPIDLPIAADLAVVPIAQPADAPAIALPDPAKIDI